MIYYFFGSIGFIQYINIKQYLFNNVKSIFFYIFSDFFEFMKKELFVCFINIIFVFVIYGYYSKNFIKSVYDVFFYFFVGCKKYNMFLVYEYCVFWQYIGFLMVDEICLLYLIVLLRKVFRCNRILVSLIDVEKLLFKYDIYVLKVYFFLISVI